MKEEEKDRKAEENDALIRKLIIGGGVAFVFLSILLGFKLLGFFSLIS